MYKLLIVSAILLVACAYAEVTLENCKCWDFYVARQHEGGVRCDGERTFDFKPCNMPQAPRCICTEDKVTGILTDKDGTWCSQSEKGELIKKWPCENKEEWSEHKVKYEEFEKTYLKN